MPGRFDLRPLLGGLGRGVRKRRHEGEEPIDRRAIAILVSLPVAAVTASLLFKVELRAADQLIAGVALLVGAFIASFAQVASWRDRLIDRRRPSELLRIRALTEAGAHLLTATVAAVVTTATLVTIANIDLGQDPSAAAEWTVRVLSAAGIGLFTYLAATMIVVINLLWDAFEDAAKRGKRLSAVNEETKDSA